MMKVFKKDHCQLTYKPGSQDAITTKNEMIYNLLYLYVLRLKIRLDRHLFLLVRCLVVWESSGVSEMFYGGCGWGLYCNYRVSKL